MTDIAILGLGAMGSRMAAKLIEAGHRVTVWNRSHDRTGPLADAGARAAPSPREAVKSAAIAIAMVRDDDASRFVWTDADAGALAALDRQAIAIESSTLSLGWTRALAHEVGSRGIAFLDAPVVGSRPQAEAGQLIYLVGGDAAVLDRVRPILQTMGGAIHHAGDAGTGTAMKLAVNALFGIQVAAVAELMGMLEASGVELARAVQIMGETPPASPAAKVAMALMLRGAHAPLFPVNLVEKDFSYALDAAGGERSGPLSEAARAVFRSAIERGYGDDNLTAVRRLYEGR